MQSYRRVEPLIGETASRPHSWKRGVLSLVVVGTVAAVCFYSNSGSTSSLNQGLYQSVAQTDQSKIDTGKPSREESKDYDT